MLETGLNEVFIHICPCWVYSAILQSETSVSCCLYKFSIMYICEALRLAVVVTLSTMQLSDSSLNSYSTCFHFAVFCNCQWQLLWHRCFTLKALQRLKGLDNFIFLGGIYFETSPWNVEFQAGRSNDVRYEHAPLQFSLLTPELNLYCGIFLLFN